MNTVKLNVVVGDKVELNFRAKFGRKQFSSKIINIISNSVFDLMIPGDILSASYVSKDSIFDVVIVKDDAIFEFAVIALGKVNDNITGLRVQINSNVKKIQRRDFFRLQVINGFRGREVEDIKGYKFGEIFDGNIMDISGGGALIHTNKDIYIDKIVELSFKISNEKDMVLFGVVLRRTLINAPKYTFEYGVKFINITEFDRNALTKYIFEAQRKLIKKGLV